MNEIKRKQLESELRICRQRAFDGDDCQQQKNHARMLEIKGFLSGYWGSRPKVSRYADVMWM